MRAHPERPITAGASLAEGFASLLAGAVGESAAGCVLVDAQQRVRYANEAFAAQCGLEPADLDGGELALAGTLGAALVELAEDLPGGSATLKQRVAYREGSTVVAAEVTASRHALGASGEGLLFLVREPEREEHDPEADDEDVWLRRAAIASGAAHWHWDLAAGRVWYEDRLKTMLGYGADDIDDTFAALQALIHDDERPLLLQALRLHIEQRGPLDLKVRVRLADGEYRWHRLCGAATRDPSGRPVYLSGRLEDISAERRDLETMQRVEESLRRTLDGLPFSVGVLNASGELVEINRAWREFAGDRALIGLRYGFGDHYARLCREAIERCASGPTAATGVEDVISGRSAEFELDYRVADELGARLLQMSVRPLDVDGQRGAIVTHKDITDLERAHGAARATKEFFELILDSLPLNIAYVNRRREFVYANRGYEEWFQLPLAALQGRRLEEMSTADNYRQMAPRIESVLSGSTVEYLARSRRGDEEHELAVTYLPHTVDGQVAGFFAVVQDVTVERRLEQELRHAQKLEAIGQLTGGIAHDFNNLLSVVIGNLQLLERPLKAEPRHAGHIATALRAALRGADLTRRLLAFARQQVLEPRVLNATRQISGTEDLIRRTLGPTIEVESDLRPDTWSIYADAAQLESSVLNLAINARDAMPAGGRLSLATRNRTLGADDPERHPKLPPGDYVEISVGDTGVGMSPEVAKRAFEPFFTTKETGKGTGLGLSMVYGFAEQSGGVATIASVPGRGTTVRMYFPRSQAPGSLASDGESEVGELPGGSETVLVVDDDADVRATAASALRVLGYRVLEAGNGHAALATLARERDVALLLADLILPGGMPGAELAARADGVRPGLRVLHTSAFSQPGLRELSAPAGTEVLHKPYAIGELARRVRAVLDRETDDGQ
ncbi:MAG: PAS domain-containing protein [Proteobacteria bacterium]|nr:PAS domain-containing protein [Pseudomonadota bacterium]